MRHRLLRWGQQHIGIDTAPVFLAQSERGRLRVEYRHVPVRFGRVRNGTDSVTSPHGDGRRHATCLSDRIQEWSRLGLIS